MNQLPFLPLRSLIFTVTNYYIGPLSITSFYLVSETSQLSILEIRGQLFLIPLRSIGLGIWYFPNTEKNEKQNRKILLNLKHVFSNSCFEPIFKENLPLNKQIYWQCNVEFLEYSKRFEIFFVKNDNIVKLEVERVKFLFCLINCAFVNLPSTGKTSLSLRRTSAATEGSFLI